MSSLATPTWPALPLAEWQETYSTLHMWTQIIGKIRGTLSPWLNHSWHVPLYVTARGLTSSPIPYESRTFQMDFDFTDQQLKILTSWGGMQELSLRPVSVAEFHNEVFAALAELGIQVRIHAKPNEVPVAIPFPRDQIHHTYVPAQAAAFWGALVQADRVLKDFRCGFIGKCSPVHFFWGGFDLAVSRFSGRKAPRHPGGIPNLPDWITREAYSHELSSAGFWPGGPSLRLPAFYSYAYPEPPGFKDAKVAPRAAYYNPDLREFILPYEEVRQAASPESLLLEFLQSTYDAAARLGNWDRENLEREKSPAEDLLRSA